MIRIETDDPNLTLDDMPTNWGGGVWLYNGIPFTGIVYEYLPNTNQLWSEVEHKDGIPDGRQVEYYSNGSKKEEYYQKYDHIINFYKIWNEQGVLISHSEYDNNGNRIKKII